MRQELKPSYCYKKMYFFKAQPKISNSVQHEPD